MVNLEKKIPPPVVAGLAAACMWGLSRILPAVSLPDGVRLGVCLAFVVTGVGIDIAALLAFRRARTTIDPRKPESTVSLVTTGIYTKTRNPMYLGLVLYLMAWAVYLASPWALLMIPVFVLYLNRYQIRPEERALSAIFGHQFTDYQSNVRRWI